MMIFMIKKLEALQQNDLVESVIQFGSSVNKKQFRDIDLCIFTTKKLPLKKKLALTRHLPELYDISFYEDLPINLKKAVLSEGRIIFTKDYLKVLKRMSYIDLEYPRFRSFLINYHQKKVALS